MPHIFHAVGAISREGIQLGSAHFNNYAAGIIISARVGIAIIAALLFVWSVDYRELLSGLVRLRLPYPLSLTIYLALRYVPLMRFHHREIRDAIKVRLQGLKVRRSKRLRLELSYLFLLFLTGLRTADITADAIILRGRDVTTGRPLILPQLRVSLGGVMLVMGVVVIVLAAITG